MSIYLDEFEKIYGISDNVEKLRSKVIELGVFGKIIPEIESRKSADELLDSITERRKELIKNGDIRKPYGGIKPIESSEIEKKIPKTWSQARLKEIGDCQTGTTPSTNEKKYYDGNIPFIKPGDILNGNVDYDNNSLTNLGLKNGRRVEKNSILMVCIGGSIGKVCHVDRVCSCNQQINYILPFEGVEYKYLYYVMRSHYFQKTVLNKASGSATPIINKTKWSSIIIPIPTLEEQKRIVEKIEKLVKEVDKLEEKLEEKEEVSQNLSESIVEVIKSNQDANELKENLKFIINNFDVIFKTSASINEMRNIVLQLAIEGKLVQQNKSDEPASELVDKIEEEKEKLIKNDEINKSRLKIKGINIDEYPYDVLENWSLERLGNICFKITDGSHNPPPKINGEGYEMLSATNILNDKIDFKKSSRIIKEEDFLKEHKRTQIEKGDLLLTIVGTLGRSVVVDTDKLFTVQRSVAVIKPGINVHYLRYVMLSPYIKQIMEEEAKGTAQRGMYLGQLANLLIPIPPLEEQKRIVKKVDSIMEIIDKLEMELEKEENLIEKLGAI